GAVCGSGRQARAAAARQEQALHARLAAGRVRARRDDSRRRVHRAHERDGAPGPRVTVALLGPLLVYGVVLGLHVIVPARWTPGYVVDPATGQPLRSRLNGLRVLFASLGLYAVAGGLGWIAWDVFYVHRLAMAAGACLLGLVFTLAIVLPAPPQKSFFADLYLG